MTMSIGNSPHTSTLLEERDSKDKKKAQKQAVHFHTERFTLISNTRMVLSSEQLRMYLNVG